MVCEWNNGCIFGGGRERRVVCGWKNGCIGGGRRERRVVCEWNNGFICVEGYEKDTYCMSGGLIQRRLYL